MGCVGLQAQRRAQRRRSAPGSQRPAAAWAAAAAGGCSSSASSEHGSDVQQPDSDAGSEPPDGERDGHDDGMLLDDDAHQGAGEPQQQLQQHREQQQGFGDPAPDAMSDDEDPLLYLADAAGAGGLDRVLLGLPIPGRKSACSLSHAAWGRRGLMPAEPTIVIVWLVCRRPRQPLAVTVARGTAPAVGSGLPAAVPAAAAA